MSSGFPGRRLEALERAIRRTNTAANAEGAPPAGAAGAQPGEAAGPPAAGRAGVEAALEYWLSSGQIRPCFVADELLAAKRAESVPLAALPQSIALPAELVRMLEERDILELFSHQAESLAASFAGRHVVIATPTASGKSLCFHLPVLSAIARDPSASALYLYPTKALSRDQEHGLGRMLQDAGLEIPALVYDGDTPGDARRAARERGRIILTNPDMLHAGILPNHARWASVFNNLKYVVLDELHTYRGVFGSHMAHVIARLARIARFHGSSPRFICATATIGNPREHAARLLGLGPEQIALVDRSGAPTSTRQLFVYNPPIVNAELGIRGSALKRGVNLAADLVQARVPTLVFSQTRNSVEVMLKYLRQRCPEYAHAIMGYRGGYLPETRRQIERGLRNGEILCVVATNALELGIDIGDLQAVVCVGYPGSIAGTWQRFGRAGRRGGKSIALLVLNSGALDQYLAREPKYLLETGAEEARIDPHNVEIVVQHLKCASFELPFAVTPPGPALADPEPAAGENYACLDTAATRDALEYLSQNGLVHQSGRHYHWIGDAYPASNVSLRSVGWDNFVIIDLDSNRSIAELDWRAAHSMLHEQAIYQHDADQYQVERLDYDNHKAFVRRVSPDYFTTALTYRKVEVIEEFRSDALGGGRIGLGEVKVVERVTGYKKIKFFTHENAGYGDVHLPEMQMHTSSFWLILPEQVVQSFEQARSLVIDALRSAGVALEVVSTLALMCEPNDINRTLGERSTEDDALAFGFEATLFLFDAQPGGVGLAERIYEQAASLVLRARRLIATCPCDAGCPGCIGPGAVTTGKQRKRLAVEILTHFAETRN